MGTAGPFGRRLAAGLAERGLPVAAVPHERWASAEELEAALPAAGSLGAVVDASLRPPLPAPLAGMDEPAWIAGAEEPLERGLHLLQAARRRMAVGGGRVVVIVPSLGLNGAASLVPWVTAVEGYRSLVRVAARAWGAAGITLNTVAVPGPLLGGEEEPVPSARPGSPPPALGRLPDIEGDVAGVVAMLLGDGAGPLTGMTVAVDGGVWMTP